MHVWNGAAQVLFIIATLYSSPDDATPRGPVPSAPSPEEMPDATAFDWTGVIELPCGWLYLGIPAYRLDDPRPPPPVQTVLTAIRLCYQATK